jgi:hypothetical protein
MVVMDGMILVRVWDSVSIIVLFETIVYVDTFYLIWNIGSLNFT